MKKLITITIECETEKDNEYIQKALRRGTYKALDTTPYYVSAPQQVQSITINVEDINTTEPIDPSLKGI